ncbi:MAG: amidohydrolase family protein [Myxococcota bacterium]|nr:amidohydrolase family protein [Myxococcota bacterium]
MHDLVFKNAQVLDGTGSPARQLDVAVTGDRITAVGTGLSGAREIDCSGMLLTPGFVDIHTHYDGQVTWDPYLSPSSWHGVTTVVMGNCGVGFAPAAPDKHDWLIGLMEGVEDIPGAALAEGIQWAWESFPEYLDAIDSTPHAIDFGAQVPHGALRAYVMGERGAANKAATEEDIAQMAAIVKEALEAGALGFSTSRTMLHKSIDGVPVPGTFATREELFGIGQALKDAGTGVYQLACEHLQVPKEIPWMRELAEWTGRPVSFNLSQTDFAPTLWQDILPHLDKAHQDGVPLVAQVAGRPIGILFNWRVTAHPFVAYPFFQALEGKEWDEALATLQDPTTKAAMLEQKPASIGMFEDWVTQSFDKMFPMRGGVDYEPAPEQSIAQLAKAQGRDPRELAYEMMLENDGRGFLYFPLFNYSDQNLDVLHTLHTHPQTRMGLSDGGAHCGAICDGGMPTFMASFWPRDRSRGDHIELAEIIRRQTSETAELFGLNDRGRIAVGYKADLNVIDYDQLKLRSPELVFDLPSAGRRLIQKAEGYKMTVCSGQIIMQDGEPTGALPGRLVRGAKAAPQG